MAPSPIRPMLHIYASCISSGEDGAQLGLIRQSSSILEVHAKPFLLDLLGLEFDLQMPIDQ